jgi:glutamate synthase (NADPH/NADH) large chain
MEMVFVTNVDDVHERVSTAACPGAPPDGGGARTSRPVFHMPLLSASTIVYKGMVMPQYLPEFFPDLADERMESSVAVFHQRFSTNTLPQWRLSHPYRHLAHNGEINTHFWQPQLVLSRADLVPLPLLPDLSDIQPLVSLSGSDSQTLDNMLEVLLAGGPRRAARHAVARAASLAQCR